MNPSKAEFEPIGSKRHDIARRCVLIPWGLFAALAGFLGISDCHRLMGLGSRRESLA